MFRLLSYTKAAFWFCWICSLFIIFISSLRLLFSLTFLAISSFLCCSCELMVIIFFFNYSFSFNTFSFASCFVSRYFCIFLIWSSLSDAALIFDCVEIPKCFNYFFWHFFSCSNLTVSFWYSIRVSFVILLVFWIRWALLPSPFVSFLMTLAFLLIPLLFYADSCYWYFLHLQIL